MHAATTEDFPPLPTSQTTVNTDESFSIKCQYRGDSQPTVGIEGDAITNGLFSVTSEETTYDTDTCYYVTSRTLTWGTEDVLERRDAGGKVTCWGQNQDGSGRVTNDIDINVECECVYKLMVLYLEYNTCRSITV